MAQDWIKVRAMRIRALKIKNFRAHENSYIEFNDGINLIIGQNGSGKTSILEAIFAAIYLGHGSFPKGYKKVNTRIGSSGFELYLKFEHNGKTYEIVRKSTGESYLRENGAIIADKDSNIAKWAEKHLYPLHVYRNALYIKQGEIENILIDEDVREKVLRKVLGIEDYENAEKNAQEVIKELKRKKENLTKLIESSKNLEDQIRKEEEKLRQIFKKINELRKLERELFREFSEISQKYEELKKLKSELEEKEKEKLSVEGTLKSLEESLKSLEDRIHEVKNEIKELKEKEKKLKDIEWVKDEYKKLKTLLAKKNEFQEIRVKISSLNQKLKGIEDQIKELQNKKTNLQEVQREYEEALKEYKELKIYVEQYEKASQLLTEKEKYENELKKAGYTREKLLQEIYEVEKTKEKLKEIEDKIVSIKGELNGLNKLEQSLKENLLKLEGAKKCPLCKRPIREHDEEEIKKEYSTEFFKIEEKRKELAERLTQLEKEKEKLEKIQNKERKLMKLQKTLEFLENVEKKLKEYNTEELRKKAEEFEKVRERAIELKKELTHLKTEILKLKKLEKDKELTKNQLKQLRAKIDEILTTLKESGFSSFEEVEKKLEDIEPVYREYIELRKVPDELVIKEKKLKTFEESREEKLSKLNELRSILKNLERKVDELKGKFSREQFEKIESQYFELSKKLSSIETEIKGNEQLKEEVTKYLEDMRKRLEEIKNAQKKLEVIDKMIADMKVLREKLIKFKAETERRGLEEVERVTSELFAEMTERKYQGIKIVREKKYGRERIGIMVLYQGREESIEFLSGGERIALGLSFRLALSLYKVKNMELLILDEPTPFLDEERRKKLIEIITQHLRKIPQVIIVSHDEELKDAADYVIRVSMVGGKSNVEVENLATY